MCGGRQVRFYGDQHLDLKDEGVWCFGDGLSRRHPIGLEGYWQLVSPLSLSRCESLFEVVEQGFLYHFGMVIGLWISRGGVNIFYPMTKQKCWNCLLTNCGILSKTMAWGIPNRHMMLCWMNCVRW